MNLFLTASWNHTCTLAHPRKLGFRANPDPDPESDSDAESDSEAETDPATFFSVLFILLVSISVMMRR